MLSMLWGQATPDAGVVPLLALQRWYAGLTLSSPDPTPRPVGLWAWLAGLGLLFVVSVAAQGPIRALGQLFDLAGHVRLVGAALTRLRRAARLVVATLGATVVAW